MMETLCLLFADTLWWGKARSKTSRKIAELNLIPIYVDKEWFPYILIGVDCGKKGEVLKIFQLEERMQRKEYKLVSQEFRRWRRWIENSKILNKEK